MFHLRIGSWSSYVGLSFLEDRSTKPPFTVQSRGSDASTWSLAQDHNKPCLVLRGKIQGVIDGGLIKEDMRWSIRAVPRNAMREIIGYDADSIHVLVCAKSTAATGVQSRSWPLAVLPYCFVLSISTFVRPFHLLDTRNNVKSRQTRHSTSNDAGRALTDRQMFSLGCSLTSLWKPVSVVNHV